MELAAQRTAGGLPRGPEVGEVVEVATRFTGSWSRGFVVADIERTDIDRHGGERAGTEPPAYRLRRMSDGQLLPVTFSAYELRADRGRAAAASHAGAA